NPDVPAVAMELANRMPLRTTFSRDGRLLVVASDRLVTVWDVGRERQIGQIALGEEAFHYADLSPDNRTIAVQTSAGTSIWELATFLRRSPLHQNEAPMPSTHLGALRLLLDDAPSPL